MFSHDRFRRSVSGEHVQFPPSHLDEASCISEKKKRFCCHIIFRCNSAFSLFIMQGPCLGCSDFFGKYYIIIQLCSFQQSSLVTDMFTVSYCSNYSDIVEHAFEPYRLPERLIIRFSTRSVLYLMYISHVGHISGTKKMQCM